MELANNLLIVIDPGHGGYDSGASHGGRLEKDDNLRLALEMQKQLTARGMKVLMTRTNDSFVSLQDRAKLANEAGADLFLSLHRDLHLDHPPVDRSIECAIHLAAPESTTAAAARMLIEELSGNNIRSGGAPRRKNHYILRKTHMPAISLEIGYITDDSDNHSFDGNLIRNSIAIAKGIMRYFEIPLDGDFEPEPDISATKKQESLSPASHSLSSEKRESQANAALPPENKWKSLSPSNLPPDVNKEELSPIPHLPQIKQESFSPVPDLPPTNKWNTPAVPDSLPENKSEPIEKPELPPINRENFSAAPSPSIKVNKPEPFAEADLAPSLIKRDTMTPKESKKVISPTAENISRTNRRIVTAQKALNDKYGFKLPTNGHYDHATKTAVITALQSEISRITGKKIPVDGTFDTLTKSAMPVITPNSPPALIFLLQVMLMLNGYDVGEIDGVNGPSTRTMIMLFQRDFYLIPNGTVEPQMTARLLGMR